MILRGYPLRGPRRVIPTTLSHQTHPPRKDCQVLGEGGGILKRIKHLSLKKLGRKPGRNLSVGLPSFSPWKFPKKFPKILKRRDQRTPAASTSMGKDPQRLNTSQAQAARLSTSHSVSPRLGDSAQHGRKNSARKRPLSHTVPMRLSGHAPSSVRLGQSQAANTRHAPYSRAWRRSPNESRQMDSGICFDRRSRPRVRSRQILMLVGIEECDLTTECI